MTERSAPENGPAAIVEGNPLPPSILSRYETVCAKVVGGPGPPRRERELRLAIETRLAGQFQQVHLELTVTAGSHEALAVRSQLLALAEQLGSTRSGQEAKLLLRLGELVEGDPAS
jgi:hypothetical protein